MKQLFVLAVASLGNGIKLYGPFEDKFVATDNFLYDENEVYEVPDHEGVHIAMINAEIFEMTVTDGFDLAMDIPMFVSVIGDPIEGVKLETLSTDHAELTASLEGRKEPWSMLNVVRVK